MTDVKLYCGDCLEVMATLDAGSIDAIITDLPYGTTACKWDEVIPFAPMWAAVKRVLKPRGVFVTTASQPFTSALVMSNLEWFRYEWVWEKDKAANVLNANRQPLKLHENILVFSSGQSAYNPQMIACRAYSHKNRSVLSNNFGSNSQAYAANGYTEYTQAHPKSIIRHSKEFGGRDSFHPTQKPVALYAYLIRTYTNPGDTVLDFVMGSGTTGVAAIKEGRNFVGCDNDASYFAIATKRIAEAQMQMPLLDLS